MKTDNGLDIVTTRHENLAAALAAFSQAEKAAGSKRVKTGYLVESMEVPWDYPVESPVYLHIAPGPDWPDGDFEWQECAQGWARISEAK